MKKRATLANLGLLLAALAVPLVGAEVSLRLAVGKTTASIFEDRPGFERSRGMKRSYEAYVYGVHVMTNELGFRDDTEQVPPKLPNNFRVVVLGDSLSVGLGIPYDQIFSSQMEQDLTAAMGNSDLEPQALNLAVGGYNLIQYNLTMKEVGWSLDPDVIVVALLVGADFLIRDIVPYSERKPRPWHHKTRIWQRIAPKLRLATKRLDRLTARAKAPRSGPPRPRFGPGAKGWDENAAALIALQAEANARGVPLVAFLMPTTSDFKNQQAYHDIVGKFCAQNQIDVVDLLPEFMSRKRPAESYRLNVLDQHPNALYHRTAGEVMSEHVQRLRARADSFALH